MPKTVKAADPVSLATGVREQLEQIILSGEYAPGERLNELALTERLGVSRGIIREATRSLENARLVEIIPNRGVVVRTVDVPDALELFDVRAGLASAAGRLAAARATTEQLRSLAKLHEEMNDLVRGNDSVSYATANHAFHDAVMLASGNSRLQELDLTVRNEMQLYIRKGVLGEAQLKVSNLEHGRILNALKAADAEAAAREFELHILNGKQRMLESLRSSPARRAS
ncbi:MULTISPECIES: GntR family transcriptional regulator [Mesorhizobium]|uniref:GntR family transcriptional regulator n=1 Tax=Mesorhizobium TaxID=68287 RepID=UPI0010A97322|nr:MULTISPECIES: GntR family transcriptional regulator [Mesorhizobium]